MQDFSAITSDVQSDPAVETATPEPTPIAVAYGNGIDPEITEAVLCVLDAAALLQYDIIDIGKSAYERGIASGIPDAAWDAISFSRVLDLLGALHEAGWDVIKTEHLYTFDGQRAYSLGQGE